MQFEMVAGTYVLAMTSIGDRPEGFRRLTDAVFELDREIDMRMREKEWI